MQFIKEKVVFLQTILRYLKRTWVILWSALDYISLTRSEWLITPIVKEFLGLLRRFFCVTIITILHKKAISSDRYGGTTGPQWLHPSHCKNSKKNAETCNFSSKNYRNRRRRGICIIILGKVKLTAENMLFIEDFSLSRQEGIISSASTTCAARRVEFVCSPQTAACGLVRG